MPPRETNNPVRQVASEGDALVVSLTGDIDLHRSPELEQKLLTLLARTPQTMVLDLAEVPYMDSSGLATLVKLLSHGRRNQIELKLCGLSERVKSMFEITRLDGVFGIYGSVEEALA